MNINIKGTIASDEDAAFLRHIGLSSFFPLSCPEDVRQAIAENPEGEELVLEINSPGGSVMAAAEMWSALLSCPHAVRAVVQSFAGSAASVLMTAADTVVCSPVAQIMIHLPSTTTQGNEIAHKQSISLLQSTRESIINAYLRKTAGKTSREALRGMMEKETWLIAQKAVEVGLCDAILGEETTAVFSPAQLVACGTGFPDFSALRAAFLQTQIPPPSADAFDLTRAKAALEIAQLQ